MTKEKWVVSKNAVVALGWTIGTVRDGRGVHIANVYEEKDALLIAALHNKAVEGQTNDAC